MSGNAYSGDWFSIFMETIDPEQTRREAAFVSSLLPPRSRVLDLPCGTGRHARQLAALGHSVLALDRERAVLPPNGSASVLYACADMRELPLRAAGVDAIICLWQSFGQFEPLENAALLRDWAALVRPGGLLVLDLYDRSHFESRLGEREFVRAGRAVRERRSMHGDRLIVELRYGDGERGDRFEWQLFSPDELRRLAAAQGWEVVELCSGFQRGMAPDPERPRVQYVLRAVGRA